MSSIKPPGGKSPLDRPVPASAEGAVRPSEASEAAQPSVHSESVAEPAAVQQGDAAELSPVDALSAEVVAGRVSPDAAVEALVQRALADVAGVLSPAQQQELEATLRAAVADDPTLVALRREWES